MVNTSKNRTEPRVATYECAQCGAIHNTPSGLPVGWSANASAVWCGSCTAAGIPARQMGKTRRAA